MKNKPGVSIWIISRMLAAVSVVAMAACSSTNDYDEYVPNMATPTVDYVERLDVYSAPHKDSFLNQLAMNYRSYAIYNARTSGYPDVGELFAQKAVAAFSGELPFPESLNNWDIADEQAAFELHTAYTNLLDQLKNDASDTNPKLAAEAQAKFDCWLSAAASGQGATAAQCRDRFNKALAALRDCKQGRVVEKMTKTTVSENKNVMAVQMQTESSQRSGVTNASNVPAYYPETRGLRAVNGAARTREGVIIVNNVNVPETLIRPEPVQPLIFHQNIYGGDKTVTNSGNDNSTYSTTDSGNYSAGCDHAAGGNCAAVVPMLSESSHSETVKYERSIPPLNEDLVTREEFINMMMAMRAELAAINARLDKLQTSVGEKTMIKVQQIPLEPKQHVMEEVFEIHFDFNKANIKPEYEDLIRKLATATQENKNIKVSVVGHTDTMGSSNYNYALGGRRAEAVQKMLIEYGIPASQIVAVSSGEQDLQVPTPDNTPNAQNRRVRVVKETYYTEPAAGGPLEIQVGEYPAADCGMYGCDQ